MGVILIFDSWGIGEYGSDVKDEPFLCLLNCEVSITWKNDGCKANYLSRDEKNAKIK
jgi:hypothetical protein